MLLEVGRGLAGEPVRHLLNGLGEGEDLGEAQDVGKKQHQEHDQDGADQRACGAAARRQAVDLRCELRGFRVAQRDDARLRLLDAHAMRLELVLTPTLQDAEQLAAVGRVAIIAACEVPVKQITTSVAISCLNIGFSFVQLT